MFAKENGSVVAHVVFISDDNGGHVSAIGFEKQRLCKSLRMVAY